MAFRTLHHAALLAKSSSFERGVVALGGLGQGLISRHLSSSCVSSSISQQQPGVGQQGNASAFGRAAPSPLPSWASARGLHWSSLLGDSFKVNVPAMSESISEGQIAGILKKEGDAVKEDDVIAQIETDKVTIDVKYTNKVPGIIKALHIKDGDTVVVGALVADVEVGAEGAAPAAAPAPSAAPKPAAAAPAAAPKAAAPAKHAEPARPPPPSAPLKVAEAPRVPPQSLKPERRVKMTRLRLRVAERLKGAQNTYAMLTTFNEVDMTALMELRAAYKDVFFERHGVKLGFMSCFVKAAAQALQEIPAVNGVIDGDEIVYRDYYDISIAVATPKGLVVPVLRGVDKLSFAGVEKNIGALGKKARDGTIGIDDMAGGTFTISNGGVYGSLLSTPIINPPQSAILGMHATNMRPAVVNGKVEVRPIMNLALTYDHRLIDGREAVTFLKKVKDAVEDPRRMLLDL